MSTDIALKQEKEYYEVMEKVVAGGDISKLSAKERMIYYNKTCQSVGLNPLTRPFEFIHLNGKLTMYTKKDATEQLRSIHGVSIYKIDKEVIDDIYVVTAYAKDKNGKEDIGTGAVVIAGLKADAKANAFMKAETKAKRRVTLSICGLGMLDESELDTVKNAAPYVEPAIAEVSEEDYNWACKFLQETVCAHVESHFIPILCDKAIAISSQEDMEEFIKVKDDPKMKDAIKYAAKDVPDFVTAMKMVVKYKEKMLQENSEIIAEPAM